MNGKKIACLILLMIIAGISYGTQIMQKRTSGMQQEAEDAATGYEMARSSCEIAEIQLTRFTADTAELRRFLTTWTPHVDRLQSSQEAEQAIMSIVRAKNILTLSQKFEVKSTRTSDLIPRSLVATLVVQDDYAKTMNWLGEIERKIPLARITGTRLQQGDGGHRVNLEVRLEIPLINLKADVAAAKK